jgi:hypothetical protein
VIDDVRVLSTATGAILGEAFANATPVRREDVPIVREHAARRVHQGVSLDAFLHAYRAALFGYWDAAATEAARLDISRDASLALARFAFEAIDTITTHAAEAYLREEGKVRTRSGRAARDLIDRLLGGLAVDEDRRPEAAPGLDPRGELITIVGRVHGSNQASTDALQAGRDMLEESLALGRSAPLTTIRQGEIVAIAAAASSHHTIERLQMSRRRAREEREVDLRFGFSAPATGFAGVPRSYREAALAASYATPERAVVSLVDLSSFQCALLGADATTRAVIASKGKKLQAMGAEERGMAEETVRAFAAADLNVSSAAAAMHLHPNTVRYRLARIASASGHDPRTFAGLLELLCVFETPDPLAE